MPETCNPCAIDHRITAPHASAPAVKGYKNELLRGEIVKIPHSHMFAAALAVIAAYPAVAQSVPAKPYTSGASGNRCELHVWPAEQVSGHGLYLYNGLIRGRSSSREIDESMADLLTPYSQISAMHDKGVASSLGLPISTVVVEHKTPLDHKTITKVKGRRSDSKSSCYYELFMTAHSLVEDIVWGDRFISGFAFRNFKDSMLVTDTIKGVGGNKLTVFTQSKDLRPADAPQLVAAAVRANFQEYAKNVRPKVTSAISR